MHIYVNGDSNAAGDELADECFTGWPGYQSYHHSTDVIKAKKWFDDIRQKEYAKLTPSQRATLVRKERALAWPALLGEMTGATVTNNGQSGSSQGSITYRTMMDLMKTPVDKVFIMITSHLRIDTYGTMWGYLPNAGVTSIIPQYHYESFKDLSRFADQWDKTEPDYGKAARFLKEIILLREFVKGQGIEPIFLDSAFLHMMDEDINNVPEPFNQEMQTLINNSGLYEKANDQWKPCIDSFQNLIDYKDTGVRCPSYHFSPMMHKRMAEHLYNKYFKE